MLVIFKAFLSSTVPLLCTENTEYLKVSSRRNMNSVFWKRVFQMRILESVEGYELLSEWCWTKKKGWCLK